jgi:plastocyanin
MFKIKGKGVMKYKYLVAIALVAFLAAGCNKTKNNDQPSTDQTQNSTTNDQDSTPQSNTQTKDNAQKPDFQPSSETAIDGATQPEVVEVKISSTGFMPATITIRKNDYVQFTNTDTAKHWPASDPHPTHTGLPGFDADKGLANGENYRYQFTKVGTFGYHDHLNPALKGTVIVK